MAGDTLLVVLLDDDAISHGRATNDGCFGIWALIFEGDTAEAATAKVATAEVAMPSTSGVATADATGGGTAETHVVCHLCRSSSISIISFLILLI